MDESGQRDHQGDRTNKAHAEPDGRGHTQSDAPSSARVRRRSTLEELLVDPDASAQLTRETMWLQAIPAVGNEIG